MYAFFNWGGGRGAHVLKGVPLADGRHQAVKRLVMIAHLSESRIFSERFHPTHISAESFAKSLLLQPL
jgi:hypothetical protein